MRTAINLASIKEKSILLVKKKDTWILPGGKPKQRESFFICIERECKEELPLAKVVIGKKYKNFIGKTPHRGDLLTAKVYFGEITGNITPSAEIVDAQYFTKTLALKLNLSEITKKIIDLLVYENYI